MSDNTSNNKRIAKNTLILYFRMFLMMAVSLYTSRVVLKTLGEEDYGIYNVVGSVVAMFTFVSSAMGNATSRYITYTLGTGNKEKLRSVFNTAFIVHVILAIFVLILGETIGIWFLNTQMTIPIERLEAANWVFQCSIVSTMVAIINIPFSAELISHEKMSAFAYLSLLDIFLKLLIVYLIVLSPSDKLILYAALMLCIYLLDICVYWIYCKRKFPETKLFFIWDKRLIQDMIGFAGWSLIGNMIWIGYSQGLNILLNIFCGPTVNAARGIAFQVQGAVKGFVTNFQMAVNPQITKAYAQGNLDRVRELIFSSSKISFILVLFPALPIMIEAKKILNIWLVDVPEHTVSFVILTLLMLLYTPLENPIGTANNATGRIKKYQIITGSFNIFIVVLSYICLKIGYPPESVFIVQLGIVAIVQFVKAYIVHIQIHFSMSDYILKLFLPLVLVSLLSASIPLCIRSFITNNIISIFVTVPLCVLCICLFSYTIALNKTERTIIHNQISKVLKAKRS